MIGRNQLGFVLLILDLNHFDWKGREMIAKGNCEAILSAIATCPL